MLQSRQPDPIASVRYAVRAMLPVLPLVLLIAAVAWPQPAGAQEPLLQARPPSAADVFTVSEIPVDAT